MKISKTRLLLCALIAGCLYGRADTYVKVTNASDLVSGEVYIIGNSNGIATGFSSNALTTTSSGYTEANGTITTTTATPLEFTLGTSGDNYTLRVVNGNYLGYSNNGTDLRNNQSSASNSYEKWTIAYNSTHQLFTIVNVGDNTRYIGYDGYDKFKAYSITSNGMTDPPATLYKKNSTVATPTFTLAAGTYVGTQSVSINCETDGANIYYTTDGTEPTTSSTLYNNNQPISVSASCTIKVLAKKAGKTDATAQAAYTIVPTPTPQATAIKSNYYTLVTDVSSLADGDAIIIANSSYAMGSQQNDYRTATYTDVKYGTMRSPSANAQKLTLVKSGDYYFFYTGSGYLYAASSTNNSLRTEATADMNAAATISISNTGNTTITFQGSNSHKALRYNSSTFACYTTGSGTGNLVQLYKEVSPTVTTTRNYTSFCSPYSVDFTGTAITVCKAKVDGHVVRLTAIDGNIAPADNGVILVGEPTTVDMTFTATTPSVSDNDLIAVLTDTAIPWNPSGGVYNYILQNGVFKKATGAKLRAGRAYLSTSYNVAAGNAPELQIVFGDVTGISDATRLDNNERIHHNAVYDLQGRKIAKAEANSSLFTLPSSLNKGLYIVNGKKVVIK